MGCFFSGSESISQESSHSRTMDDETVCSSQSERSIAMTCQSNSRTRGHGARAEFQFSAQDDRPFAQEAAHSQPTRHAEDHRRPACHGPCQLITLRRASAIDRYRAELSHHDCSAHGYWLFDVEEFLKVGMPVTRMPCGSSSSSS